MKDSEAIRILGDTTLCTPLGQAAFIGIEAIKELQKYKEIETEIREQYLANVDIKKLMQYFIETIFKDEKHERFCVLTNEDAMMWEEYQSIGTVEECQEAVEKQRAKKPFQGEPYTWISSVRINGRYRDVRKTSYHHVCSNCRENVAMDMRCCKYCGQAIDWSDTP